MKRIRRYEIRGQLGEGGMGVVFRAYDPPPVDREVALKTLPAGCDPLALQLFYQECKVLKSISHPNIIEIFDIGEVDEGGQKIPFFVMPILPGQTLDALIRNASHRLTVERVVEIMSQTCRGLQAAHEAGLVHRDLKPSNVFVMGDDSVKIIDFGVAHMVDAHSRSSGFSKGTLLYMSPEQVQHKPVSPQSDIFSLGVVCYEALTRRQPFRGATEDEVVRAILTSIPPTASDINPAVSQTMSRVIHKAMAKQPWNRYESAREFGQTLWKALRNEPIELFGPARIQPRIQRATKALESGDYQFAGEIIGQLEAEGHTDPEITLLRAQIDQVARHKTIAHLLESARARYEEDEDPLALQKIEEILQLDPGNVAALDLKSRIQGRRSERQIENWIRLARQHADNHSYAHARDAVNNVLALRPKETRATRLLNEIDTAEQGYLRIRGEKTERYQAALNAWKHGEVTRALSQMKIVLELDRQAPDSSSPAPGGTYQAVYDRIRSEHDAINSAYANARRCFADRDFAKALQICDDFLSKYPNQAVFQSLKLDIEEERRQQLSGFVADVDRRLDAEPDLDAKVSLIREAVALYPDEAHFRRSLELVEQKRDLVNSIVNRARVHEQSGQISEAVADLEILETIYSPYPGLKFEKERLQKRLEEKARAASRPASVAPVVSTKAPDQKRDQHTRSDEPPHPTVESTRVIVRRSSGEVEKPPTSGAGAQSITTIEEQPAPSRPDSTGVSLPELQHTRGNRSVAVLSTMRRRMVTRRVAWIAMVLGAALAGAIALPHLLPPSSRTAAMLVGVHLHTNPTGATIRVDDQYRGVSDFRLDLETGDHRFEASLPGYESATATVTVRPGPAQDVLLTLKPLMETIRVAAPDLAGGEVWLDNRAVGKLQNGALAVAAVEPGRHLLRISTPLHGPDTTVAFETTPGKLANVIRMEAPNRQVVVLSTRSGSVRVKSNFTAAQMAVDGEPTRRAASADGVGFDDLQFGRHELTLGSGQGSRTVSFVMGHPAIEVILFAARGTERAPPAGDWLSQIRGRAEQQRASGNVVGALETIRSGLDLDPKDPGLLQEASLLVRDGEQRVERARDRATRSRAPDRAVEEYREGASKEAEAANLKSEARRDRVLPLLWTAADLFERAAARAEAVEEQLKLLRRQAAEQAAAGQQDLALKAIRAGLALDPGDPPLLKQIESVVREAEVAARGARQHAERSQAATLAKDEYAQAVEKEQQGLSFRNAGRAAEAALSFRAAVDLFDKAARRAVDEPRPTPKSQPTPETADEAGAVRAVLRDYEAAYERLDAAAVSRLVPSLRPDQLNFDALRSYELELQDPKVSIRGDTAVVTCLRRIRARPKAGGGEQVYARMTEFRMRRSGTGWIIESIQEQR